MPIAEVNGLELCYESTGRADDPPLLLVAGLGVQLIDWADHIVEPLVAAGHRVITFDNRDIGLSTTFDGAPSDPQQMVEALMAGNEPDVAYTLADMAADGAGLLDAIGIDHAHIVGVSMGGMIAQTMAIMFPEKIRSLTSIMSTTGAGDVGQPTDEALEAILSTSEADDRASRIAHDLRSARVWASPGHFDETRTRALFEASWDRVGGTQQANIGRQFCAVLASPPRDELLALVDVPTLVVHGSVDPLVSPSGGERTADVVPNAKLLMIEGMAHDMSPAFAPDIVRAISDLVFGVEVM